MKMSAVAAVWLTAGLCFLLLLLQMAAHQGGYLHWESSAFLLNYTDGRGFWTQIWDVQKNDWGLYQARELSYIFDRLDANFIDWSIRRHWIHFYSLSALLLVTGVVWVQQWLLRVELKVSSAAAGLISFWFVLLECVSGNLFFRSAKYLAGLGIAIVFLFTVRMLRQNSRGNLAGLAAGLLLLILADRQGMFYAVLYTLTGAVMLLRRDGAWRQPLMAGLAVSVFGIFYNVYLAPLLIYEATGYGPSFAYQQLPEMQLPALIDGVKYVLSNLGFALTGFAAGAMWCGLAAGAGVWYLARQMTVRQQIVIGMAFAGIFACAALMQQRHPVLLDPETIFGAYFYPAAVIVFGLLILAVRHLPAGLLVGVILLHLAAYLFTSDFQPTAPSQKIYQERIGELRRALGRPGEDIKSSTMPYRLKLLVEKYQN